MIKGINKHWLKHSLILLTGLLALNGCRWAGQASSSTATSQAPICRQIADQLLSNRQARTLDGGGQMPSEQAALYKSYKKYHCDRTQP